MRGGGRSSTDRSRAEASQCVMLPTVPCGHGALGWCARRSPWVRRPIGPGPGGRRPGPAGTPRRASAPPGPRAPALPGRALPPRPRSRSRTRPRSTGGARPAWWARVRSRACRRWRDLSTRPGGRKVAGYGRDRAVGRSRTAFQTPAKRIGDEGCRTARSVPGARRHRGPAIGLGRRGWRLRSCRPDRGARANPPTGRVRRRVRPAPRDGRGSARRRPRPGNSSASTTPQGKWCQLQSGNPVPKAAREAVAERLLPAACR